MVCFIGPEESILKVIKELEGETSQEVIDELTSLGYLEIPDNNFKEAYEGS